MFENVLHLLQRMLLAGFLGGIAVGAPGRLPAEEIELRTIFCPIVTKPPIIDGTASSEEWRGSATIDALRHSTLQQNAASRDTLIMLLADSSTLYAAFVCGGPDGKPKDPKTRKRDASVSTDNLVTLFLDMEHNHQTLHRFAVDYLGTQSDAFNPGTGQKGGDDHGWNARWRSAATRGDSSWTVEMAIPLEELTGRAIAPGTTMGINFLRRRPDVAHDDYLMTSPLAESRFYWAHIFADLVFGPPGVVVSKIDFPEWRQGKNTVGVELRNYGNATESVAVAARVASMAAEETWEPKRIEVQGGQAVRTQVAGHMSGDREQRIKIDATSGSGAPRFSAAYRQLTFGPPALQFAMPQGRDERDRTWNIATSNSVCFQPERFAVTLRSTDDQQMEQGPLRVRTELLSGDSGRRLKSSEFPVAERDQPRAAVDTSSLPDGRYVLRVALVAEGDATLLRTAHQVICIGEEFKDVIAAAAQLRAKIGEHKEGAESLHFSRSSFLHLEYLVQEAERLIAARDADTYRANFEAARKLLAEAQRRAAASAEFRDPLRGKTGLVHRAFVSPYNGEIRPYSLFIPRTYDGARPTPVVTEFLNSGPPAEWTSSDPPPRRDWPRILELLEKKGFIMVWPGPPRRLESEVNFFAIMEQMKRDYNIDADRVYLMGISGGGLTSWQVGLLYPDQIAAICPISGVSIQNADPKWPYLKSSGFLTDGAVESEHGENPESRKKVLKATSAYYFPMNALHVPVLVLHGDADPTTLVDVQARPMVKKMRELGLDVEYVEYPGAGHGLGEHFTDGFSRAMDFFDKHRRASHPHKIDYTTPSLRYNKAYWIRIGAFLEEGTFARVQAEASKNRVDVTTDNVAGFTLLRDGEVFDANVPVKVIVDKQAAFEGSIAGRTGIGFIRDPAGTWRAIQDRIAGE